MASGGGGRDGHPGAALPDMVVYGSITNTSVATLFASGFLPAFVMAVALMVHVRIDAAGRGFSPT